MKWFLVIVLICVIMLIAKSVSEQYKEKFDFYNNLKIFLHQFKLNLSFRQEKIINFLETTKSKKQFNCFINSYKNYLITNKIDFSEIKILDTEEKNQLSNIITKIGKHDVINESSQIELFILEIEEKTNKAKKDKEKLCPMIIKLSLLFAIGLVIILI